jgi:hypothetical protein
MVAGSSGLPTLILPRGRSHVPGTVEDGLLNQSARRAGAHFALVEGEQSEAFQHFVEIIVVGVHYVGEEHVRRLAAQLQGLRYDRLRRVLHDQTAGRGFSDESDFCDARVAGQGFSDFATGAPVTTLTTPGGSKSPISSISTSSLSGVLEAGFDYNAISGHDLGCELPRRDEQREIPGDDLADDAERSLK